MMSRIITSLGEVLSQMRNGTTTKQNTDGIGYKISRIETISDGSINPDRVRYAALSDSEFKKWRVVKGDILLSHINSVEHIGKSALYNGIPEILIHGMNLLLLRVDSQKINPEYLAHFLKSDSARNFIRFRCKRAINQVSINQRELGSLPVPVPQPDEQQRIVDILNRVAHIERLRDRAGNNLRDFLPALFIKMFGNPVTNPMGWDVVQLGDLCNMDRQGIQPNDPLTAQLPFVGVENVVSGTGVLNFATGSRTGSQKSTAFRFDERHVLYGKLRPYLNKVATPEFAGRCSTELVPLLPHANVNRSFLAHLLRHKDIVEFVMASVTGTRMPRADMKALLAMPVPLPPLEKQRRFADIVKRVSRTTTAMQSASKTASALRASLMSRFFRNGG